jgi:hypothetical protein
MLPLSARSNYRPKASEECLSDCSDVISKLWIGSCTGSWENALPDAPDSWPKPMIQRINYDLSDLQQLLHAKDGIALGTIAM